MIVRPLAAELGIGRVIAVDAGARLTRWAGEGHSLQSFPEPHSLAILQYTGGTTGRSKGVNLTHAAVSANVSQREALLPSGAHEKILIVTPMYHSYAIAMGLLLAPYCRGTLSILPRYRPDDTLRTIEEHGITPVRGQPDTVCRPDGAREFRDDEFLVLDAVLFRCVGASDGDHAPLGGGNELQNLRRIRTKRSGAGPDLQSARGNPQAWIGRRSHSHDRHRNRRPGHRHNAARHRTSPAKSGRAGRRS